MPRNKPTYPFPWSLAHQPSTASECDLCLKYYMVSNMYYYDLGKRFKEGDPKRYPFQGQRFDSLVCQDDYDLLINGFIDV